MSSTVFLRRHDEDVRNLIHREQPERPKPERYTSKFSCLARDDMRRPKADHGTFGYAKVPLDEPNNFLKKNSRIVPPRPVIDEPRCLKGEKRPPIPGQQVAKQPPDSKDFRRSNITSVVRATPPQPQPRLVDTRAGDLQTLDKSGLSLRYVYKKSYGQVPDYLQQRCRELHETRAAQLGQVQSSSGRYVSESERSQLLEGLRKNWEELQRKYQLLPIQTDTLPKKRRKLHLESRLKRLEHDIRTMERHRLIYVLDDGERESVGGASEGMRQAV